jgi:Flp pilus assembly pilin Flp
MPSSRSGENFIEFALIIILLAIVMLSILLIVGDSIREFANDFGLRWSLSGSQSFRLPAGLPWIT